MAVSSLMTDLQIASGAQDYGVQDACAQTTIATPADYRLCRQIMHGASKNYSFASAFLPRDKQPHVEALYAFLRVGDDRVDVSHPGFASAREAIEDWERAYWNAFETCSIPDPVLRAYLDTANTFRITPGLMDAYFSAMKSDLTTSRFATFGDLLDYMEGSAMTVGRDMTYIMGIQPGLTYAEVMPHADALAIAMQLSNFWRDIAYDWSIGRVYIPQEDLDFFGVREADLAGQRVTPQFKELLEYEIQRTEDYYEQARLGVPMLASGQWGVMSALEMYRAILPAIRRSHYDVFSRRAGASTFQKLALVARAGWNTRHQ
jgi:15-cis-phytoene synthase